MAATVTEQHLFAQALECATRAERDAYLDGACMGDAVLRRRVEMLLVAAERAEDFLEHPFVPFPLGELRFDAELALSIECPGEKPGDWIARYRLLEKIGEGGFGDVYMAEQEEPVRRRVALKIIKPGMDSRAVIARFEAERQALAMMEHPNIARVLDGGATSTGRPYFVMELVRGVPITEYCDAARLGTAGRLALFNVVCQAVQHAHQKGIIHRDLKPSNNLSKTSLDRLGFLRLGDLRTLNISDTKVSDLGPLAGSPLLYLDVKGTEITDLSPLLQCRDLSEIVLPQSAANVALLRSLPQLRRISFERNREAHASQTAGEFWRDWDARKGTVE